MSVPETSSTRRAPTGTYREIVQQLSAGASKTNKGAPGYTRWVNRPLGRRAAAWGYLHGRTPNQLTFTNAAVIFPVFVLIALVEPSAWWSPLAALLLLAAYVLDSADGMLARLRGGGSKAGEWLDHAIDSAKTSTVHVVVAVAMYRFYDLDTAAWLLVPLAFGIVHATYFFALMLADDLRRLAKVERGVSASPVVTNEKASTLRSLIMLPNDWGVLCLTLALLPVPWLFITVYGLLLVANALFLAAGSVRWYRELVTL